MKLIYVFPFLFFHFSFSQEVPNDYISLQEQFVVLRKNEENSKIEGSQFFEDDFKNGHILQNGKKILDAVLRYNVVKEQVEIKVKRTDEEVFVLPRLQQYVYDFGSYQYVLKDFKTKEGELILGYSIIYFQDDDYLLLSKPSVKVRPEMKAETTYGKTRPAHYSIRKKYYFGINGEPLEEVKMRERTFENILDHSKKTEDYFDSHKINDVDDVVELLKFNGRSNIE